MTPTARTAAFDAVVRLAIDGVHEDSGWGYQPDFETVDVVEAASVEVSDRTARRAAKGAAALGWVEDRMQGWDSGPRAEEFAGPGDENRVTVCDECEAIWEGLTSHCQDCGNEFIRQVEPRPTE